MGSGTSDDFMPDPRVSSNHSCLLFDFCARRPIAGRESSLPKPKWDVRALFVRADSRSSSGLGLLVHFRPDLPLPLSLGGVPVIWDSKLRRYARPINTRTI